MARAPVLQDVEAFPESDRLEDFPHPRETAVLYGHDEAERELAATFAAGRMHHGWLLAGPEGIGKATLAYRLAAHVLARPEERAARSLAVPAASVAARQVRALSHPGLLVLRRPYDPKTKRFVSAIPVDEVRRLRSFLSLTASDAGWRVVLVDPADDMNVSAANAILKSLEEPPPRTLFVLITAAPGRLLATIRSRCRLMELAPLAGGPLREAVAQASAAAGIEPLAEADIARLERIAGGSVRRVLALATSDGLALAARVDALLGLLPKVDWPAAHVLADELAPAAAEQKLETFLDLLQARLRGLVRCRSTGRGAPDDLRLAERIIPVANLAMMAQAWQAISDARGETDALNLDRRALVLDTLARLSAAAKA